MYISTSSVTVHFHMPSPTLALISALTFFYKFCYFNFSFVGSISLGTLQTHFFPFVFLPDLPV